MLEVEARFDAPVDRVVASAGEGVADVDVVEATGTRPAEALGPARGEARFRVGCAGPCAVRYRYDLAAAAAASGDSMDVAVRAGSDVLAPASTWLLRPEPLGPGAGVELRVRTDGVRFASGMSAAGPEGVRRLSSQELWAAGYTAFGSFTTLRVPATGGVVDVAILGGDRSVADAAIERWIGATARALDTVFGRFPVARAQLFVVPDGDAHEVTIGRTLPAGGASTAVFVGGRCREDELAADWILTHELFHLGVPSFWREGRWLDEGLATYYEPLLRARAGLTDERRAWRSLAGGLPRGVARGPDDTLIGAERSDRVYWGGAAFVLRADVEIRRRTAGAVSLDTGLAAVLARGGDATRLWNVDGFLRVIDETVGVSVLVPMYERELHPDGAPRPDGPDALASLLAELGVALDGRGVRISADAPLATIRGALSRPARGALGKAPTAPAAGAIP